MRHLAIVRVVLLAAPMSVIGAQAGLGTVGGFATEAERPPLVCTALNSRPVSNAGEVAVPADYDGDGLVDTAAVRPDGTWLIDYATGPGRCAYEEYHLWPADNGKFSRALPGYYDRDCKADRGAVNASGDWYIDYAADGFGNWVRFSVVARQCPHPGRRRRCLAGMTYVPADYDGDGITDLAVKRGTGQWQIDYSNNGYSQTSWDADIPGFGSDSFIPVPADYDGDGKADFSTRDADNWYVDWSANGRAEANWDAIHPGFGHPDQFVPVPADYDGDGKSDFSSRDGDNWYIDRSANGRAEANWDAIHGGFSSAASHAPVPADYDGLGRADLASHTQAGDWHIDFAANGFGAWDTGWNTYAELSAGTATAEEARQFDLRHMTPGALAYARATAAHRTHERVPAGAWEIGERLNAMIRMFETTRDRKYLEHLRELLQVMLDNREDRRPDFLSDTITCRDADASRCATAPPLAAWGGRILDHGPFFSDSVPSGMYSQALAAFARIVFEDASLHAQYGATAVEFANAALETVLVFTPEFRTRDSDGQLKEGYFVSPAKYGAWSEADCTAWYQAAKAGLDAEGLAADSPQQVRLGNIRRYCIDDIGNGGRFASPHNISQLLIMPMIEITRALDSPYYQTSPNRLTAIAPLAAAAFPRMIAQSQRYFMGRMVLKSNPERYNWKYQEISENCCEDFSHGGVSMRYIGLLFRNKERLAARSPEPILLTSTDVGRFANTFLRMTANGNIPDATDAIGSASDPGERNYECWSWIELSVVDRRVYERCKAINLRRRNGAQWDLFNAGAHAALLHFKR